MSKCQRDREIRHTTSHTHTQKLREQIERRRDVKDKRQNQIRNDRFPREKFHIEMFLK